jgi:hypothetical protein
VVEALLRRRVRRIAVHAGTFARGCDSHAARGTAQTLGFVGSGIEHSFGHVWAAAPPGGV